MEAKVKRHLQSGSHKFPEEKAKVSFGTILIMLL